MIYIVEWYRDEDRSSGGLYEMTKKESLKVDRILRKAAENGKILRWQVTDITNSPKDSFGALLGELEDENLA